MSAGGNNCLIALLEAYDENIWVMHNRRHHFQPAAILDIEYAPKRTNWLIDLCFDESNDGIADSLSTETKAAMKSNLPPGPNLPYRFLLMHRNTSEDEE